MKTYIKRISVLLAILMLLSSFPMASAYEFVSPDNVTYLDASFATLGVEDWYAWTWSDSSNGRWVQGDEVSPGVYSFNYLDGNVLFARVDNTKKADWNNDSVFNQTEDLVNHTADYFYTITAWKSDTSNKMQGKWTFVGPNHEPTEPTVTVEPPTTQPFTTVPPTTDTTQPTENARDSLYNTVQRIRNSIPIGGTPFTRESQQRFNAALKRAEELLNDASATDAQLREAEQELIAAFNALERSTANRKNLWYAIEMLRGYIESGEYKNFPNADELKEIYDYALPVYYYEPDQSVIDEWTQKIYKALEAAGVITPPTTNTTDPTGTTVTQPTIPTSEPPANYTEPTETTEDPTGHCTEHDLPYSPEFAVALADYSYNLVGESLSTGDIDIFYFDQYTVVFGMSDMLCTVGEEDIDGYHFENWNFFPRQANKTGYCVYKNGTIYNLPDAVKNNIMTARALASIIPHSYKIDDSTKPTTPSSYPTEITEPTLYTEPVETGTNGTGPTEPTTQVATYNADKGRGDLAELVAKYKWVYADCFLGAKGIFYFESTQRFVEAYESAQALLNDSTATEQQFTAAYAALIQAYNGLMEAHTQPTMVSDPLKALKYSVYHCVLRDGYEYTPLALANYNEAYDEAVNLLNSLDVYEATDEELWAASRKLGNAYSELMRTATYLVEPATEPATEPTNPTQGPQPPITEPTDPTEPATEPVTASTEPVTETTPTQPTSTTPATYSITKAKVSAIANRTYTGKAIAPTIKVTYNGKILLKNKDYTLSYKNNTNVGTASIVITGKGSYTGKKTVTFKIVKANNTITVKAAAKIVKYKNVKKAKQTVTAITISKAIGKVTYKKSSGSKFLTLNSNGKITVKKGTKKGTYTIKITVTAAGSSNYKSGSKTVTVKITVK